MKRSTLPALAALLVPLATDAENVLPDGPHVYVEGSAEIEVEPDRLTLELVISEVADHVADAKQEVDRRARALLDLCARIGIEERDLSSTTLAIGPAYEWRDGERELEGTRVAQGIEIVLRDFDQYAPLIRGIVDAEVAEVRDTTLSAEKQSEVEDRALQEALADARRRAEMLAGASGRDLGPVHSISEFQLRRGWLERGRLTVTSFGAARDLEALGASAAEEPFSPGLLRSRASVYVVYELRERGWLR